MADTSTGGVNASRRQRPPLTPFVSCIGRTLDRSSIAIHAVVALRAIAVAHHASHLVASTESASLVQTRLRHAARHVADSCDDIVSALLQDRLPTQVASLISDRSRPCKLLAVAFFQQFLSCNHPAREASFSHLDALVTALVSERNANDSELHSCMCSLIHNLIYRSGCEERMVLRLQREGSPRTAASLEEWFLETLLVQHGALDFLTDIQQPDQVDAWTFSQAWIMAPVTLPSCLVTAAAWLVSRSWPPPAT